VPQDDLQARKFVEQPAHHEPDRVGTGFVGESPSGAGQLAVSRVDSAAVVGQQFAGVQIDRHAEFVYHLPEAPQAFFVQVLRGVLVANVRKAVDQSTFGTAIHRATQLLRGGGWVLHRKNGERAETVRVCRHVGVVDEVVGLSRQRCRLRGIGLALRAVVGVGDDHLVDAVFVHFGEPLVDVDEAGADLASHPCAVRIRVQRVRRSGEARGKDVFLERDHAGHLASRGVFS
jgi:hypothetical protein